MFHIKYQDYSSEQENPELTDFGDKQLQYVRVSIDMIGPNPVLSLKGAKIYEMW